METSFFKLFPLNLPITVTSTKRNVKACRLADRAIAIFYRALADGQSGSIYIMLLRRCFSCFLRPSCHRTSMAFLWLEHNHHFHSQSSYFTWFLYHRPEYNGWCFSLLASFFFFLSLISIARSILRSVCIWYIMNKFFWNQISNTGLEQLA